VRLRGATSRYGQFLLVRERSRELTVPCPASRHLGRPSNTTDASAPRGFCRHVPPSSSRCRATGQHSFRFRGRHAPRPAHVSSRLELPGGAFSGRPRLRRFQLSTRDQHSIKTEPENASVHCLTVSAVSGSISPAGSSAVARLTAPFVGRAIASGHRTCEAALGLFTVRQRPGSSSTRPVSIGSHLTRLAADFASLAAEAPVRPRMALPRHS
jgi:hypothetical protein